MFRLAVYPGSFDPPTLGHLDLLRRATGLFDQIIVATGRNSRKEGFLTEEEKLEALRAMCADLPGVKVAAFDGLLVEYARSVGARCVIRGLRATPDFEYEFQMAMVNRRLADDVETIFLMAGFEHSYLSSSIVREVATLGGDVTGMVHPGVAPILRRAVSRRASLSQ